jgi:hypothetical protein
MELSHKDAIVGNNTAVHFIKYGKFRDALSVLHQALHRIHGLCVVSNRDHHRCNICSCNTCTAQVASDIGSNFGMMVPCDSHSRAPLQNDSCPYGQNVCHNNESKIHVKVISSEYDPKSRDIHEIPVFKWTHPSALLSGDPASLHNVHSSTNTDAYPMLIDSIDFDSNDPTYVNDTNITFHSAIIMYNLGVTYRCLQLQQHEKEELDHLMNAMSTKVTSTAVWLPTGSTLVQQLQKQSHMMFTLSMSCLKVLLQGNVTGRSHNNMNDAMVVEDAVGDRPAAALSYFDFNRLLYFEIFLQYNLMDTSRTIQNDLPIQYYIHQNFLQQCYMLLSKREQCLPTPGSQFAKMA